MAEERGATELVGEDTPSGRTGSSGADGDPAAGTDSWRCPRAAGPFEEEEDEAERRRQRASSVGHGGAERFLTLQRRERERGIGIWMERRRGGTLTNARTPRLLYRARGEARDARRAPCARALSGGTKGNGIERLTGGTHYLAEKEEEDDGRATGCEGKERWAAKWEGAHLVR